MKRLILIYILSLTLSACGAPGQASAPPEASEQAAVAGQPTPTVRVAMIATDPATFVQAAGQPQLVEFFAFW